MYRYLIEKNTKINVNLENIIYTNNYKKRVY